MKVKLLGIKGTWREVADAARTTIGLEAGTGEPSSSWKRRILLAEHSPIRKIHISWKWYEKHRGICFAWVNEARAKEIEAEIKFIQKGAKA